MQKDFNLAATIQYKKIGNAHFLCKHIDCQCLISFWFKRQKAAKTKAIKNFLTLRYLDWV
jgi:hypothetical protein